jgi:hypothetical protein
LSSSFLGKVIEDARVAAGAAAAPEEGAVEGERTR